MKKNIIWVTLLCCFASVNGFAQIKGDYAIKNVQTGMLLRIKDANTANGTPLVAYNPVNWKCMTWNFKPAGENIYQLQNLFSGKTFQAKQAGAAGIALEEQPLVTGAAQQQYEFIPLKKNTYLIRLKGTGLYITPADEKGAVNSGILLAAKKEGPLQQWTIYEQHPEM